MKFFRRREFEEEMDAELRHHLEEYTADLVRSGVEPPEARRRARLEFGSLEAKKEECRQAWGLQGWDELRADLRVGFRGFNRNPGFAALAILSLALGIGANTAIFSLVDAVLLRLLPVRDPAQLFFVQVQGTVGRDGPPYPLFELLRDHAASYDGLAAFSPSAMEMTADRGRELVRGVWVSGNFYETLGAQPVLGRSLTSSDDQTPANSPVAVISRAYWQQRLGGDPGIVGRRIRLFDTIATIVGVMPSEIMSLEPGVPLDVAFPMSYSDPKMMRNRTSLWLEVVGRLKSGVNVVQARAEAEGLFRSYMTDVQISDQIRQMLYQHIELSPAGQGSGGLRRQFSQPLTALMVLAGLVLLAACINMTNLMLARAAARQRDHAIRLAIGASRGRLIRQTLTESMILAGAGALVGVLFAHLSERALAAFFAEGSSKIVLDLSLNGSVLAFTVAITLISGLAIGIIPAMRSAQVDPAAGMRDGARGVVGSRVAVGAGRLLVVAQVALSLVLLSVAGLFIRSLGALQSVDLGFVRAGLLTMEVTPEHQSFGTSEWLTLQTEILDQVRVLPGVQSVAWATVIPLSGRDRGAVVEIHGFSPQIETDKHIHLRAISPSYFATLGVTLVSGRGLTARDHSSAAQVAILNETAARFYFGERNPLGQKLRFTNYPGNGALYEIAGVVRDYKDESLREPATRSVYVPIAQSLDPINRLALTVRCMGPPLDLAAAVRERVQAARSTLLITNVTTMDRQIDRALFQERLMAALATSFGAVSVVLAGIGLYGILAYNVSRRTNEIGIRMALGATRTSVVWLVLWEGLALAGGGIAIGFPLVWILGRLMKALLFGIRPFDVAALAGATVLLLAFAVSAAILPGRRAGQLDPASALMRE